MKNLNITKSQAISIISNILRDGCAIPMASTDHVGAGFEYFYPFVFESSYDELVSWLSGMSFRIVPISEISEEFSEVDLDDYEVCVEFTDGNYSEQYLLWDIKNFID